MNKNFRLAQNKLQAR